MKPELGSAKGRLWRIWASAFKGVRAGCVERR